MIFSGNNTSIDSKILNSKLKLMIANGTTEPNNNPPISVFSEYYQGALYAGEQINKNFTNFDYEFLPTDCGNFKTDFEWQNSCLKNYINSSAIAYLSGFWISGAFTNAMILKSNGLLIPQVLPYAASEDLGNREEFPEFIQLSGNYFEYIQNSALFFSIYEWHSYLLIHDISPDNRLFASILSEIFKKTGFVAINSKQYRMLPANYSRENFEEYRKFFEYIKDTKCRIMLLVVENSILN